MVTAIKGNATSTFGGNVDVTGNVVTDAPAFSAYPSAVVSASNTSFTKLPMNTEDFDTNSNYDTSTYKFTPTVAGYYQINGMASTPNSPASGVYLLSVYKNGSRFLDGNQIPFASTPPKPVVSALVYMNGTTDYLELYAYQSSGTTINLLGSGKPEGFFQASLMRAV